MFTLNCKGRLLVIDRPVVMGILNTTPDSFFAGSRMTSIDTVVRTAASMLEEGAVILDIGGQSTRPGSEVINEEKELARTVPAIEAIISRFPECIISIDTYYARVAREAVAAGASIVNDISAGALDKAMIETVASLNVPYVLMHMKGTPQTMQHSPVYENVTREVMDFFIARTSLLRSQGIRDIILDPGFGFGKNATHNFELLNQLDTFRILEMPLLAGLSRKGSIYRTLDTTAEHALNGTTVANTIALLRGASILRVHDVKAAREAVVLVEAVMKSKVKSKK